MKRSCDYHPTRTAHWFCPKCDGNMCPDCVVARDMGEYHKGELLYFCPKCNRSVEWCGVENIIDPFWKHLPKVFAYPFSSIHPIALIISSSILLSLFMGPGLFNLLARSVLFLVVLKYSFEALKSTASGDLSPPGINSRTISNDIAQVVKQYVLFYLIFLAAGWIYVSVSPLLSGVFRLVALFFAPAMVILLVTTSSLFHALNPLIFVRLTYRIGWGYVVMYLFLLLLGGAPSVAAHLIFKWLPQGLHMFLISMATSYYTMISYHLMGYVILQYHEDIGYKIEQEDFKEQASDKAEPARTDAGANILREISPLIQEGKYDDAISVIKTRTSISGIENLELSERYYSLLKMTDQTSEMSDYGIKHLDLVIMANQKKKAFDIYSECSKLDKAFLPTAASLFKIGDWLNETGKFKEAVRTFNRLIKAYPDNALIPKSYFRAAQIFNDRMMNPEKATKILNGLRKKYPGHEIVPKVENYLAGMR